MRRALTRLMPFLLIVAILGLATQDGRRVAAQLFDGVKVFAARLEMDTLREALEHEYARSGALPGSRGIDDLLEFAGEHLDQRGRDAGLDLWGNPYVVTQDTDGFWLLVSTGPNGEPDDTCDSAEPDPVTGLVGDDLCVELRLDKGAAAFR